MTIRTYLEIVVGDLLLVQVSNLESDLGRFHDLLLHKSGVSSQLDLSVPLGRGENLSWVLSSWTLRRRLSSYWGWSSALDAVVGEPSSLWRVLKYMISVNAHGHQILHHLWKLTVFSLSRGKQARTYVQTRIFAQFLKPLNI